MVLFFVERKDYIRPNKTTSLPTTQQLNPPSLFSSLLSIFVDLIFSEPLFYFSFHCRMEKIKQVTDYSLWFGEYIAYRRERNLEFKNKIK